MRCRDSPIFRTAIIATTFEVTTVSSAMNTSTSDMDHMIKVRYHGGAPYLAPFENFATSC